MRAAPVFGLAVKLTDPAPLPDEPAEIDNQSGLFDCAVHAQPFGAVTPTDPVPPAEGSDWLVGAIVNVQGAGWVMVSVWPPIVIVPDRAGPLLASAANVTDPFPVPDVALVILIHGAFDEAVHAQPAPALTVVDPAPPPDGTSIRDGDRL